MNASATVLTPPGMSALATVRLIGARDFAAQRFAKPLPQSGVVYGDWIVENRPLDDVLVVCDGDTIDVHLHGGVWIVQRFLRDARDAGLATSDAAEVLRLARQDAASAGRVQTDDLVDRLLPLASTDVAIEALLHQPAAWQSGRAPRPNDLTLRYLLDGVRIALVGRPNVGKSTLVNRLSTSSRSIVSDLAGTTRDWVEHRGELAGLPIVWIDTPGRRETTDEVEREAIELSRHIVDAADLVVEVRDATRPGEAIEEAADLVVWNKCDLEPREGLQISASTGAGMNAFAMKIHVALGVDLSDLRRPMALA